MAGAKKVAAPATPPGAGQYIAQWHIQHDDQVFAPGDVVDLPADVLAALLARGAVALAE